MLPDVAVLNSVAPVAAALSLQEPESAQCEFSLPTISELRSFVKEAARKERQRDEANYKAVMNAKISLAHIVTIAATESV